MARDFDHDSNWSPCFEFNMYGLWIQELSRSQPKWSVQRSYRSSPQWWYACNRDFNERYYGYMVSSNRISCRQSDSGCGLQNLSFSSNVIISKSVPINNLKWNENSTWILQQERFSNSVTYTEGAELDPDELWTIPVAVATADKPEFLNHTPAFWINKDVALKSAEYDTTKWIVVNAGSTGKIINYD